MMTSFYKLPVFVTILFQLYIYCLILGFNQVSLIPIQQTHCDYGCITQKTTCKKNYSEPYYYYDTANLQCDAGYCVRAPRDNIYATYEECDEDCGDWCERILEYYKPEDKCLEQGSIMVTAGKSNKTFQGSSIYWIFNMTSGKCTSTDLRKIAQPGFLLMEDIKINGGLFLKSKEECDKRCPPIPVK